MTTSLVESDTLLSVHAATQWLKGRGVRPNTHHSIYAAIARQRLSVATITQHMILIRESELARYAEALADNPGTRC